MNAEAMWTAVSITNYFEWDEIWWCISWIQCCCIIPSPSMNTINSGMCSLQREPFIFSSFLMVMSTVGSCGRKN